MKEDIKILEEFIEKTDVDYKCNYNECVIPYEIEQILKRFIKRYKELEEQNAMLRGQLNDAFDRGFIHISVIQNKIDELKEKQKFYEKKCEQINLSNYWRRKHLEVWHKIQVLQELLEERK